MLGTWPAWTRTLPVDTVLLYAVMAGVATALGFVASFGGLAGLPLAWWWGRGLGA